MYESIVSLVSLCSSMNSWLTPAVLFLVLNLMIATIAFTSTFSHHHNNNHAPQPQIQTRLTHAPSLLQRLKSINFHSYIHQSPPSETHRPLPEKTHFSPAPDTHHFPTSETTNFSPAPENTHFSPVPENTHVSPVPETHHFPARPKTQKSPVKKTHFSPELETHFSPLPENISPAIEPPEDDEEGPTIDEVYNQIIKQQNYQRQTSDTQPASGKFPVPLSRKIKKSATEKSAFAHFELTGKPPSTVAPAVNNGGDDGEGVDAMADDFINKFRKQLHLQRLESLANK